MLSVPLIPILSTLPMSGSKKPLAIENGLKTEMTESFLEGMKSLFEEHYVTIPEDKYDVLESMVEKLMIWRQNSMSRLRRTFI